MKYEDIGIMIPKYSNLLSQTLESYKDSDYKNKIKIVKELLHDMKVSLVTEFFLDHEDEIRRFYGDVENLKEDKFLNINSPKVVFNFFNEYLNGMISFIETHMELEDINSIISKSDDFVNNLFTKDESKVVNIRDAMDTLNDCIWYKTVGIDLLEDVLEKFESMNFSNSKSEENYSYLLSYSILTFSIKFMSLVEENFHEMKELVK